MNVMINEKNSFQVIGIKRSYSYKNDENMKGIPKFWEEVNQNGQADLLSSFNNGEVEGLLGVCVDDSSNEKMDYWIGVNGEATEEDDYQLLEVPAGKWAIFAVHGPMPHSMQKVWKQIYSEWLPTSRYQISGNVSLEVYQDGNPFSADYYSEIWISIGEKNGL
ncbi:GyrI-like domain-containing protein [Niallia nealsonii]|uniref:GyrI-like domain-containing protein n=1 Tax=Niallia nealsonii TaxID=115979 RepID=UPI001F2E310A|nr:GyrI-like domain-containing protein [Niallia nealsonii]